MIKFFKYVCFCGLTLLTSCDLYEEPITSIGKEAIFNSTLILFITVCPQATISIIWNLH